MANKPIVRSSSLYANPGLGDSTDLFAKLTISYFTIDLFRSLRRTADLPDHCNSDDVTCYVFTKPRPTSQYFIISWGYYLLYTFSGFIALAIHIKPIFP